MPGLQESILNCLTGIDYMELSTAEKKILDILKNNGISWYIDTDGTVRKGHKPRK